MLICSFLKDAVATINDLKKVAASCLCILLCARDPRNGEVTYAAQFALYFLVISWLTVCYYAYAGVACDLYGGSS